MNLSAVLTWFGMAFLVVTSQMFSFWGLFITSLLIVLFTQVSSLLRILLLLEGLALVGIILSAGPPLTISLYTTLMVISGGEAVMGLSLLAYSLRKAELLSSRPKL